MNKLGKLLLVVTSLAPVLGAYAVNAAVRDQRTFAISLGITGLGLAAICLLLVHACKNQLSREPLKVSKIEVADKKPLLFLAVYLLPLLSKGTFDLDGDVFTAIYVFLIVGLGIYHSNSFTFNPVLALQGYHFYEIRSETGMSCLLITKQIVRRQEFEFTVVGVSDYLYLDVE